MYMGDVKSKTFIDSNASSATYVAVAARPTSTFTLANSSFGTNTARKKLLQQLVELVMVQKQSLSLEQMKKVILQLK